MTSLKSLTMVLAATASLAGAGSVAAATPDSPAIRTTGAQPVPACVTPARLMAYVETRNPALDPRFRDIAEIFKRHGEALKVRWDYAFFQMMLETNSLKYGGDVKLHQNNFAGIGATGGGVRGNGFPDVSTGVLAQMQHLVAYSGEFVAQPVAARTREQQDGIIAKSLRLGRPVTFADLTRRWAADGKYIRSIETLAAGFRANYCAGNQIEARAQPAERPVPAPIPRVRGRELARKAVTDAGAEPVTTRAGLGFATDPAAVAAAPATPAVREVCKIWTASYGGAAATLIQADKDDATHLTVLRVEVGQEDRLAENFIAEFAAGGRMIGKFASADDAMQQAFAICPGK